MFPTPPGASVLPGPPKFLARFPPGTSAFFNRRRCIDGIPTMLDRSDFGRFDPKSDFRLAGWSADDCDVLRLIERSQTIHRTGDSLLVDAGDGPSMLRPRGRSWRDSRRFSTAEHKLMFSADPYQSQSHARLKRLVLPDDNIEVCDF